MTLRTDTAELQSQVRTINSLYKQFAPVMHALHAKYPESKRDHTTQIDTSDGFCRVIDLVPNVQQYLMAALDYPEVKPATKLETYTQKTEEMFAQSRAMLEQYRNDPIVIDSGALLINDLLEGHLLEAYRSFDALHAPSTTGVSAVANARLAATPEPTRTAPHK